MLSKHVAWHGNGESEDDVKEDLLTLSKCVDESQWHNEKRHQKK